MKSLFEKNGFSIPSLYVKSAPRTYDIRQIFQMARYMAPCLLIFEDIDTIVTPGSRSYFFNEVDGLENNDGLFMVASTNHLDQLDPGLSSRPSRFDRKYLFPLPSEDERVLYCEYWRQKLKNKPAIQFPKKLCPAIASITEDFSFAYLKEAFVATLLAIAGHRSEICAGSGKNDEGGDLDEFELWREMKKQVKLLRDDMGSQQEIAAHGGFPGSRKMVQTLSNGAVTDKMSEEDPAPSAVLSDAGTQGMRRSELPCRLGRVPPQALYLQSGHGSEIEVTYAPLMTDDGKFLDGRSENHGA